MSQLEAQHAKKLIALAQKNYGQPLRGAEIKVLRDSASSQQPKLLANIPSDWPTGESSASDLALPTVRADFLRWLLTDPEALALLDSQGLRVYGVAISGNLNLRECRGLPVLDFRRCIFQEEISLQSAEIQTLYIYNSWLTATVRADELFVHGPVQIRNCYASDEIQLQRAKIAGDLSCEGSKLQASQDALRADGAKIGGTVALSPNFQAAGTIRLLGAKITGQLNCAGAKLLSNAVALHADGAEIGDSVFLSTNFQAAGTIRLAGAKITGQLDCGGARLAPVKKTAALAADNADIGGKVSFADCTATDEIHFNGTTLHGQLDCAGGIFRMIRFENMNLDGDMIWTDIQTPEKTTIILTGARVNNLRDDRQSWPAAGHLHLDGLKYEELTLHAPTTQSDRAKKCLPRELPLKTDERIEWLMRQPEDVRSEAQPWMQLRALLEKKGDISGANRLMFQYKQILQRNRPWLVRIICNAGDMLVYLEKEVWGIGCILGLFFLLSCLIFAYAGAHQAMMQTAWLKALPGTKNIVSTYPPFQPLIYSLENCVPVLKLGMDELWMPNGAPPFHDPWRFGIPFTTYGFLSAWRWIVITVGWIQTTLFVAALTARIKK